MRLITGRRSRPVFLLAFCAILLPTVTGCARNSATTPPPASASPAPNQVAKEVAAVKAATKAEKSPIPAPPKSATEPLPSLKVTTQGVTLSWTESNQPRMTAIAKQGTFNESNQTGTLVDFSAKLYENGKLTASMRAPKAVADTVRRVVTATGGVTLKSMERNTVVKASWIKWYSKQQKIIGNGGVEIVSNMNGNKMTTKGAAFVADTAMKTLTIKDSAKGLQ